MKRQVNFFLNKKRIGFMNDGTGHQFFSHAKTPVDVPPQKANNFFAIWQRLLKARPPVEPQGAVLVALQGKLLKRRSMQTMSPLDMIKQTVAHDPTRDILLKLHPKETYSDAELTAIRDLCGARVRVIDGDLKTAKRPAILFGDCEYHHPFLSVRRGVPVSDAFAQVTKLDVPFEQYAYWYLQLNCINTSRDWAGGMIVDQCRELGWEI